MNAIYERVPGLRLIGIGHKARQGKDTAAAILVHQFGAVRYSFADDLYAVCRVLHGMQGKDAPLLQRVGVEFRERDPEIWVRCVYSKLLADRPTLAVIPDVRFPNELAFVRSMGGECWDVERWTADGARVIDPSRPADHPSETATDGAAWDRVLINRDGDLDEFEAIVCSEAERAGLQRSHA